MILDAYSRRVIGWALDRTMEDELTLTALETAYFICAINVRNSRSTAASLVMKT